MKILLFLALSISAQSGFAGVEFKPSKQIVMKGQSCEELNSYATSILEWNKQISNLSLQMPECLCSAGSTNKFCQMDVAPISPYIVKSLADFEGGYSTSAAYNGPNCFNAALVTAGTLPNINFTHPFEMTAILESSLCTEIKLHEKLVPGDILVVRDQSDKYFEIHAGTYIGGDLSFSKYGDSKAMSYSYGLNVHRTYQRKYENFDEACERVEGRPAEGDECYGKRYVNYFSCQSFYTYVSSLLHKPGGIDESVRKIYAETSTYDHRLSEIALKGARVNSEILQQQQSALRELYAQTETAALNSSINKENKEFARLLRYRIYSLFAQTILIARDIGDKQLEEQTLESPKL